MVTRPASVEDVHRIASAMPDVTVSYGSHDNAIYQVGRKSFVFFRNPRPDALDADTGEQLDDVIVFWVATDDDKQALLQSDGPYFTTPHFDGHRSVLLREVHIPELDVVELTELIQDAWLAQASRRRAAAWLATRGLDS